MPVTIDRPVSEPPEDTSAGPPSRRCRDDRGEGVVSAAMAVDH